MNSFFSDPSRAAFFHRALGACAMLLVVFGAWLLLSRWASRVKQHIESLHDAALASAGEGQSPEEAAAELDVARRRLTALKLVTNAARYVLWAAVLLALLRTLDVPLDGLLLPAGFFGAALGLGAQNLIRDVVAGLFLVFESQFAVGDTVTLNDKTGTVTEVGLRVTCIRDESGTLWYFPNGGINSVGKFARREIVLSISVPVPPSANRELVRTLVLAELQNFGAGYNALQGEVKETETQETQVQFQMPLRPVRAALAREKLPLRLASALEQAGHKLPAGSEAAVYIL
ncbi:MAG TPA: mechanosensitive ion channel domain-containing protein [Abditibacteriaceae bacterium]|jgi:small-conductance mechanosensitive channel